jgi:uncharacterized protein (TIGR03663 family)
MRLSLWGVALALFFLALALRLPRLDNRPFHADEAVHAAKFRDVWEGKGYRYDPDEFHGPTLYYAALPGVALRGHRTFGELTEADLRHAPAVFGAALCLFPLLLHRRIGSGGALWAGAFLALSPSLVFYSRYYIQEVFLIGFTLLFLSFAPRDRPILAGLAAGLMLATKETAALTFFAAGTGWLIVRGGGKRLPWKALGQGAAVAALTAYVVLSGFFSHPDAPLGYVMSYVPWLKRAGGAELHVLPWWDYLARYFWSLTPRRPLWTEGFLLILGILGATLGRKRAEVRFLALFCAIQLIAYSTIPYKTPWCGLNFIAPLALLAGIGGAELTGRVRKLRPVVTLGLLLGGVHLLWLAWQTSFVFPIDRANPLVHSPTLPDAQTLATRLERIAASGADGLKTPVFVVSRDGYYWPLPWLLRRFERVGYFVGAVPQNSDAPLVLTSPKFEEVLGEKLESHEIKGMHGLRLGVFYTLFVEKGLWDAYRKKHGSAVDDEE